MEQVITANRLSDGAVVYLADDGSWSETLQHGRVAVGAEQAEEMTSVAKAGVARRIVVEPYLIDVIRDGGGLRAVRYREQIRSLGPSVRPDVGKQALAGNP